MLNCVFCALWFLRFLRFFVRKWLRTVKIYLYAKFRASSSKIERVMLNFVFCALCFLRFFVQKWLQTAKIYLYAKFRASSLEINRVMASAPKW